MKSGTAKKKVLITGASGFIGRHLINALSETQWKIIPLDKRDMGIKDEVLIDFCDPDFFRTIGLLPRVDAVVHLGARIGWDGSSREELFVPNVCATAELVKWAIDIGAYFVFMSAAMVCGAKSTYITSESRPAPDTDYGYSKWLAEEIIRMSGARYLILRSAGVFGKDGPSHLGINKAIKNALMGKRPVQYGSGEIKRNYIYVKDLGNIIKHCIENEIQGTHLAAGASINTVSEMLKTICDVIIPGMQLESRENDNGYDQIIEHSTYLPKGISFREAIEDVKDHRYACV